MDTLYSNLSDEELKVLARKHQNNLVVAHANHQPARSLNPSLLIEVAERWLKETEAPK